MPYSKNDPRVKFFKGFHEGLSQEYNVPVSVIQYVRPRVITRKLTLAQIKDEAEKRTASLLSELDRQEVALMKRKTNIATNPDYANTHRLRKMSDTEDVISGINHKIGFFSPLCKFLSTITGEDFARITRLTPFDKTNAT